MPPVTCLREPRVRSGSSAALSINEWNIAWHRREQIGEFVGWEQDPVRVGAGVHADQYFGQSRLELLLTVALRWQRLGDEVLSVQEVVSRGRTRGFAC